MVLIEAASVGLPAIASRIYGITDAVEEGVTGILHQKGNDAEIAEAMLLLGSNEEMRCAMAKAAQSRVIEKFSETRVNSAFATFYRETFSRPKRLIIVLNSAASLLSHRLPLAIAAQKEGYEVHIATSPGDGVKQIVAAGLIHHAIPLSRSGMNLLAEAQSLFALFRLFVTVKPDLVHLVTIKPVLYGGIAARLAGVSGVVAAISGLGFVFMNTGPKVAFVRILAVQIYRLAFGKRNLKVIFQNPDDCGAIMRATHLKPSKVVMIRGSGVDLSEFVSTPLPSGVPVVVMVSRLLRDKGASEFVEAAYILRERGSQARFWLVGNPDPGNPTSVEESELESWRSAGVVELLGHRDDIAKVIAKSNIVVLPSYREGLPKVLLEAAACGRPVVTSNVPGCRDAIEEGVTGLLVPPRDARALVKAIESLLNDAKRCQDMGTAARHLAEREFSIEKVVASHLCIYRELLTSENSNSSRLSLTIDKTKPT
jgi:glycosyltransferase involved in cell wall biosynthesis